MDREDKNKETDCPHGVWRSLKAYNGDCDWGFQVRSIQSSSNPTFSMLSLLSVLHVHAEPVICMLQTLSYLNVYYFHMTRLPKSAIIIYLRQVHLNASR